MIQSHALLAVAMVAAASLMNCGASSDELRHYTGGLIGCTPEETTILNDSGYDYGPRSWQARCYGKTYQCSGAGGVGHCTLLQVQPNAAERRP